MSLSVCVTLFTYSAALYNLLQQFGCYLELKCSGKAAGIYRYPRTGTAWHGYCVPVPVCG